MKVENIIWKLIMIFLAFSLPAFFGFQNLAAQEFTASVNRNRVAVGEQFVLSFTVNTNINSFKAPNLNEFNVLSGPNQSQSMQIINGSVSHSLSYTYYLSAKHEGKITIGSATATAGGKTLQTKPITIEVVKGNAQSQQGGGQAQQGSRQQGGGNAASNEDMGDKLFLRAITSKSKVYEGEQFNVVYKIYSRLDIVDLGVSKVPKFNSFYTEELDEKNKQIVVHNENIDGVQYRVAEIKRNLLIPQQHGSLEIDPMELEVIIRQKSNRRGGGDPFDIFGSLFPGYQDMKVAIKSKTVKVEVMPLPAAGKPIDFSGAVGDFSLQTKIKPDNLKMKTNDAGNLIYTISGKGNLKLIDAFKVNWPADIEGYDAKTTDRIQASIAGLSGSRTFDHVFIPRHSGNFELASQQFTYFDPNKAKYITLSTPNFSLEIEKGPGGESSVSASTSGNNQQDIRVLGNDIKYIKTKTTFKKIDDEFYGSNSYMTLMALPAFAFFGLLARKKRDEKLGENTVGYKMKQANKLANSRLKLANTHLQANNFNDFYKEVLEALYGYISFKFALPVAQLNKDNINNLLISKGAEMSIVAKLNEVLNNCEFAQYAPSKDSSAMKRDYDSAVEIITSVEEKIKN